MVEDEISSKNLVCVICQLQACARIDDTSKPFLTGLTPMDKSMPGVLVDQGLLDVGDRRFLLSS